MCNCGKNSATPPTGTKARAAQREDAAARAKAVAQARAENPSTTRIGASATTVTQTFSLGDGLVFGSALERDAYLARHGR
jgi:hypothetical protein